MTTEEQSQMHVIQFNLPPCEHNWTTDWDWTQPVRPTDNQLEDRGRRGDLQWLWPGLWLQEWWRHGRRLQERHKATKDRQIVGHTQWMKKTSRGGYFHRLSGGFIWGNTPRLFWWVLFCFCPVWAKCVLRWVNEEMSIILNSYFFSIFFFFS